MMILAGAGAAAGVSLILISIRRTPKEIKEGIMGIMGIIGGSFPVD